MAILQIHLFGTLELRLGGRVLPAFPTAKAKSLFCYLALNRRRMFPRSVLLAEFWPELDERSARKNLRTALWRVRTVIEATGVPANAYLRVDADNVGFCPSADYWIDVEAFEEGYADIARILAARAKPTVTALESVLSFYRGDLLDELYDDWCAFERERQRFAFFTTLERLATQHADRGEWPEAVVAARRLLHHDPLREQIHRLIMRCHACAGDRAAALSQYERCSRILRQELDAAPMPETTALRDTIAREHPYDRTLNVPRQEGEATQVADMDLTLRELDVAAHHLSRARHWLARNPSTSH